MTSFVTHLECSLTGARYAHDRLHGLSDAGAPLLVRYDLDAIRSAASRDELMGQAQDMWAWRAFLPVEGDEQPVTLGECLTPLVPFAASADAGRGQALIKDEGRLATGSFKARGLAVAITMARRFGRADLVLPTAGNAGAAAAAYGAAAGMRVHVFAPRDTPAITLQEIAFFGAQVHEVDGLIDTCGVLARAAADAHGWHNLATLAEPYRLEGKKTMGLELAMQLGWSLPDVIYYPTGGGTGFIGMWKAFEELRQLGWIEGKMPRMVSVQTHGCNPIQNAFDAGLDDIAEAFDPVTTVVPGVRVPKPLGGRLILSVLRQSHGHASAVSDEAVFDCHADVARRCGVHLSLEGAACVAAYHQDLASGRVVGDESVIIFNTATGLKAPIGSA
jgi:threonine synthase